MSRTTNMHRRLDRLGRRLAPHPDHPGPPVPPLATLCADARQLVALWRDVDAEAPDGVDELEAVLDSIADE